ncbi:MAG: hypothetical protein VYD19_10985 [Myxococcota bacterium]|nr:hypothetical protein [Myxococcota bacterium]
MNARVTDLVAPHIIRGPQQLKTPRQAFIPAQPSGDQSTLSLQGLKRSQQVFKVPGQLLLNPDLRGQNEQLESLPERRRARRTAQVKQAYLRYSTALRSVAHVETQLHYQLNADGERYATSGRVEIDLSQPEDQQARARANATVAQLKALLGADAVSAEIG